MSTNFEHLRSSASAESQIVEVKAKGPIVSFSSWLSTEIVDYYRTIFVAEGARRYFNRFEANPIILWNHDVKSPGIGRCDNPEIITGRGIYLNDVQLSDVPMVRDIISPLIQDKALNQMSLNAAILAYEEMPDDVVRFTEWILWEASLVNVAGNHTAAITADTIKVYRSVLGLQENPHRAPEEEINDLDALVKAYQRGQIVKKTGYSIPEMAATENRLPYEARVLNADNPQGWLVSRNLHDGTQVGLFSVGTVEDSGVAFDQSKTAETLCRILGAKTPEVRMMSEEVRHHAVKEICLLYQKEGLNVPVVRAGTVDDAEMKLSDLSPDQLRMLRYSDVDFQNGEDTLFMMTTLQRDLQAVTQALESPKMPELSPEEHEQVLRSMASIVTRYMSMDWRLYGYIWEEESAKEFKKVFDAFIEASGYSMEDPEDEDEDEVEMSVTSSVTATRTVDELTDLEQAFDQLLAEEG